MITATTAGCTVKVPGQTTTGTSTVTNNAGPPKTITLNTNITGVKYTSSGGICGPAGTRSDGKITGQVLGKGFKTAAETEAAGIFVG